MVRELSWRARGTWSWKLGSRVAIILQAAWVWPARRVCRRDLAVGCAVTVVCRLWTGMRCMQVATGQDLRMTGQGMAGQDVRVAGQDVRVTGQDVRATGQDLRVTGQGMAGQDVRATGQDLRVTGQDVRATGQDVRVACAVIIVGMLWMWVRCIPWLCQWMWMLCIP